jgi:hypothetical protein
MPNDLAEDATLLTSFLSEPLIRATTITVFSGVRRGRRSSPILQARSDYLV